MLWKNRNMKIKMPTLSWVNNMAQAVNARGCRRRLWLPTSRRGSWWSMWWTGHWGRRGRCWSGLYLCISLTAHPSITLIDAGIHLISWVIWDSHVIPAEIVNLSLSVVVPGCFFCFIIRFIRHIQGSLIPRNFTNDVQLTGVHNELKNTVTKQHLKSKKLPFPLPCLSSCCLRGIGCLCLCLYCCQRLSDTDAGVASRVLGIPTEVLLCWNIYSSLREVET